MAPLKVGSAALASTSAIGRLAGPMPPGAHRRGSTHQSFQPIAQQPTVHNSSKEKHRVVQHGTWTPKGAPARVVFGAVSDAGCSLDGQRKTNQDSFIAAVPHPFGSTSLFAVFDGHGENGHLVSRQVMSEFQLYVIRERRLRKVFASIKGSRRAQGCTNLALPKLRHPSI